MTEIGQGVDFAPLQNHPDPVSTYVNAFQAGRQLAGQQITSTATQNAFANPDAPIDPRLAAANPELAVQLQNRQQGQRAQAASSAAGTAIANGDYDGAMKAAGPLGPDEVAKIQQFKQTASAEQQAQALKLSQAHAVVAHGLLMVADPEEQYRQAVAAAPGIGLDPAQVPHDPAQLHAALVQMFQSAKSFDQIVKEQEPLKYGKDEHVIVPTDSPYAQAAGAGSGADGATPSPTPTNGPGGDNSALHNAVLGQESGNRDGIQASAKGALGPGQIMPATFHQWAKPGEDIGDPAANRAVSARMLDTYMEHYGDPARAAVAYFSGPGNVAPAGSATPYLHNRSDGHTRVADYVQQVMGRMGNGKPEGSYEVASLGATPPPPSGPRKVGNGFVDLNPGGADAAGPHGHVATAAELTAAGLPPKTQAWTDAKGEIKPLPKDIADQASGAAGSPSGDVSKTGAEYLATIPAADRPLVQAYIDGRAPIPTGAALRNPQVMKYLQEAAQADPTFDAVNYKARNQARTDATSGKMAQGITSINTAVGHLKALADLVPQLNNANLGPASGIGNAFKNSFQNSTTGLGARWDTNAQGLATELSRTFQGGAPHEAEIKGFLKDLDQNASPAAQRAAISQLSHMLESRLNAARDQYRQGMGTTAQPLEVIHPGAASALQGLKALNNGGGSSAAPKASNADAALLAKYGVR